MSARRERESVCVVQKSTEHNTRRMHFIPLSVMAVIAGFRLASLCPGVIWRGSRSSGHGAGLRSQTRRARSQEASIACYRRVSQLAGLVASGLLRDWFIWLRHLVTWRLASTFDLETAVGGEGVAKLHVQTKKEEEKRTSRTQSCINLRRLGGVEF